MLGNVDVNAVLLLLLALEQDWLHGVNQRHGVSANVQDLLDGLHDLVTFHVCELGLRDGDNETDVSTVGEQHLDHEVVDALREVCVRLLHAWQVGKDFVSIHGEVRDESFLLLVVTHFELIVESLRVEQVLEVG